MSNEKRLPSVEKPWLKYFPQENVGIQVPNKSIYEYLRDNVQPVLDSTAIHYYGTNISFRGLLAKIDEFANAFKAIGVKEGEYVSFLAVTFPETIAALYALNKIGAIANFIDPRIDVQGIKQLIMDAKSKVLFTLDFAYPKIKPILEELNLEYLITLSANQSLPGLLKFVRSFKKLDKDVPYGEKVLKCIDFQALGKGTVAETIEFKPNQPAALVYTGGTTGFPKGVMLSNENFNAVSIGFGYAGVDIEDGDSFLDVMPIFASYGLVFGVHTPLSLKIKLIVVPKFDATKFGKQVRQYRPSFMVGVPAFYEKLITSKYTKNLNMSFLKIAASGGDTMNQALENKIHEFFTAHNVKWKISQGYGMSEVSSAASFCFNNAFKSLSVGIPSITTTFGVFKPGTTEELGYNEEGEICMTGPQVMLGYLNKPEESKKVMIEHPDGKVWVHSGDIGRIDEDGFIFIQGRVKHMVIRFDGHKVFPVQIESEIMKHSAVTACAVIGVKDSAHMQGEVPLAVVELKHEDGGRAVDKDRVYRQLVKYCNKNLEERGKPAEIVFIERMPYTSMGKQDKLTLKEMYKDMEITYKF
ncbi:MAG: acyl--CoA ligase [Bacilli bacterium]|nr:acyl--CoA ligase [Bacilli bacterium]